MNSGVFVVIFIMGYFGVREWFWERGLPRMTAIFLSIITTDDKKNNCLSTLFFSFQSPCLLVLMRQTVACPHCLDLT